VTTLILKRAALSRPSARIEPDARLRGDARGRDGGVRQALAAGGVL